MRIHNATTFLADGFFWLVSENVTVQKITPKRSRKLLLYLDSFFPLDLKYRVTFRPPLAWFSYDGDGNENAKIRNNAISLISKTTLQVHA